MVDIYDWDRSTGELVSASGRVAREDPEDPGRAVVPACSTEDVPPAPGSNQAVVRQDNNGNVPAYGGAWQLIDDFRGTPVYSTSDGAESTLTELGPIPSGYTQQVPSASTDRWDGSTWQAKPGQFYTWDATNLVWVAMTATEIDSIKQTEAQQAWDALKAFALVMLDQINGINTAINATNAAINAATASTTSPSTLKTDYPQYTAAQMVAAIKAKL